MRFAVLGPVEVVTDSGRQSIAQPRHRAFLAFLLLHANRLVTLEQVMEALWGGAEPASARSQIHVTVSRLRQALGRCGLKNVVETRPGGYWLSLAEDQLDAEAFGRHLLAARSRAAHGDWAESARLLQAGLALWRGEALADITAAFAHAERQRLHEERLSAQEALAEAELALHNHDKLIPQLAQLVAQHPLRERLVCQLMLAQYRAGRRTEALYTARRMRTLLAEEHGLDPGQPFSMLEAAILRADPTLDPQPRTAGSVVSPVRPAPPRQLPIDVQGFTGRKRELGQLSDICSASSGPRLIVIVGTAGVGKTALSVHWAHRQLDRFPDGQLYADLRGFDPVRMPMEPLDVLRRFLRALGTDPAAIPEDLEDAAALFRSHLSGRRVLVVLDNARSAAQVRPLLPGSRGCLVLVTSRNELRGLVVHEGARLLELEVLTPTEADDLLRHALGHDVVDDNPAAVDELARRCARLPLALRLAAAHLACHRHLRVSEYVQQLTTGDPLSMLDATDDGDGTLSAAFELSYRSLAPAAQRLFRLLSLIPGQDFMPAVAVALLGVTTVEVRQAIDELRLAQLISEQRPGRYGMHDLLRRYAARMCVRDESETGRKTSARRLVDFYAETVFAAYPLLQPRRLQGSRDIMHPPHEILRFTDRGSALRWHDDERDNLLGVITLANEHGWHRSAWQLTSDLLAYFIIRRHWSDWLTALEIGRSSAEQAEDSAAMAHMENAMGMVHKQTGKYSAARKHYMKAMELAAAAGNDLSVAAFNANVGGLCVNEGDLDGAVRHLQIALACPEYGQNPQYATAAYINLGCAFIEMEKWSEAEEALNRALTFAGIADDVQQACHCHDNLAEIALCRGDRLSARQHAERQLLLAREVGDPLRTAAAFDKLASALANEEQATARAHWGTALQIYQDLGHPLRMGLDEWLRALDTFRDTPALVRADKARRRLSRRLI